MNKRKKFYVLAFIFSGSFFTSLGGCNVSDPPSSTGGAFRGVVIVMSDHKSTNVAISRIDGTTISSSFISSAAAKPGLSLALSGDIDVPVVPPASGHVVLLDRFGSNVITWLDLATSNVIAQLAVGTEFESNPHDYIEVDQQRAFVARYGSNLSPQEEVLFDEGGDLLILDISNASQPTISGRIAMPEENPELQPRPGSMNWLGKNVVVTLERHSADFSKIGTGRVVSVSPATNTIEWRIDLEGLTNCGRLALSPSRQLAAIACSSKFQKINGAYKLDPSTSDIVVFDATTTPIKELRRLGVAQRLDAGISKNISFASENIIFAIASGGNSTPGDRAFAVNATNGKITDLLEAAKPYVLNGIYCSPGNGDLCLLTDAEQSKLHRWKINSDHTLTPLSDVIVDTLIGLPPQTIGGL